MDFSFLWFEVQELELGLQSNQPKKMVLTTNFGRFETDRYYTFGVITYIIPAYI